MSKQKAWWKKISIRSVGAALSKVAAFVSGGTAAASAPEPTTINLQLPTAGANNLNIILIAGAALLLVFFLARR